mmetsp:Transcript_42093/g.110890  ORF Transcript_42093/g.110890 Transcript_42093/m.110890 type:complete len:303 (+) Transcript_42093:255-1163(+)
MDGCLIRSCFVVGDTAVDNLRELVDLFGLILVEQGLPHTPVSLNHQPLSHFAIANPLLLHSLVSQLLPHSYKLLGPVHQSNSLDIVHVNNGSSIQLRLEIGFRCLAGSLRSQISDWLLFLLPLRKQALPIRVGLSLDFTPLRLGLLLGFRVQLGLDLLVHRYDVFVLLLRLLGQLLGVLTLLQDGWKSLLAQGLRLIGNDSISVCLDCCLLRHLGVLRSPNFSGLLIDPPHRGFPLRDHPGHVHSRRVITSYHSGGERQQPQHGQKAARCSALLRSAGWDFCGGSRDGAAPTGGLARYAVPT